MVPRNTVLLTQHPELLRMADAAIMRSLSSTCSPSAAPKRVINRSWYERCFVLMLHVYYEHARYMYVVFFVFLVINKLLFFA